MNTWTFEALRRADGRLKRIGPLQREIIELLANLDRPAYDDQIAFVLARPVRDVHRATERLHRRGLLEDADRPRSTKIHRLEIVRAK